MLGVTDCVADRIRPGVCTSPEKINQAKTELDTTSNRGSLKNEKEKEKTYYLVSRSAEERDAIAWMLQPPMNKYEEYETRNGKTVTRLTRYGREVAKAELLEILSLGPRSTEQLRGTRKFHGTHTLSAYQVRSLLRETGRVTESVDGYGMRTRTIWSLKT